MAKPPNDALTRIEIDHLQTLKARWDEAHAAGVAALKRRDHRAAGEALRLQRDIIEQQRTLLLFRLSKVKAGRSAKQFEPPDGSAAPSPELARSELARAEYPTELATWSADGALITELTVGRPAGVTPGVNLIAAEAQRAAYRTFAYSPSSSPAPG